MSGESFPWISGDLQIDKAVMDEIEQHALEEYPSESCGFVFGPAEEPALPDAIPREVEEETGARWVGLDDVSGVYSRPDRDPRFHAVTVCVRARVAEPIRGPKNNLEIREARLFAPDEVPADLAMGNRDMLDDALAGRAVVLE